MTFGNTYCRVFRSDDLVIADTNECFLSDKKTYNVVLIFDNSGSQTKTDPTRVRAQGALGFVDKVVRITDKYDSFDLNVSVIEFASTSSIGSNRWLKLDSSSRTSVEADINKATTAPGNNTRYIPPLSDAGSLFAEIGTNVYERKHRNFVVFLTDGAPSERKSAINQKVTELVDNYGVAMIAVAAGTGLRPDGEQLVSTMALPQIGIVDKDHTGSYRRAVTGEDMKSTWDAIFNIIMDCL